MQLEEALVEGDAPHVRVEVDQPERQAVEKRQDELRLLFERLLADHRRRDISPGAAVAEEPAVGAEDRLAADADVAELFVRQPQLVGELPERAMLAQVVEVASPMLRLQAEVRQVLASLADRIGEVESEHVANALGHIGEAQVRAHLPEPVGTRLGKILEALLALGDARLVLRRARADAPESRSPPVRQTSHPRRAQGDDADEDRQDSSDQQGREQWIQGPTFAYVVSLPHFGGLRPVILLS